MFTVALSLSDVSKWLVSLAYIESIIDATNDIEQTENKCVKSANDHFSKFSVSESLCSLKICLIPNS